MLHLFTADGLSASPAEERLILLAAPQALGEVRLEGADRHHRAQGGSGAVLIPNAPDIVLIRFRRRNVENDLGCVLEVVALVVLRVAARQVHAADHALEAPGAPRLHQVLRRAQHEKERDHDRAPDHGDVCCSEARPLHQEVPEPQEHLGRHRALAPARPLPAAQAGQG